MDLRTLINTRMDELGVIAADLPERAERLSEGKYSVAESRISQLRNPYPRRPLTRLMTRETLLALAAALETPVAVVSLAALVTIKALPWDSKIGVAIAENGDLVLVLTHDDVTPEELDARARGAASGATGVRRAQRPGARRA